MDNYKKGNRSDGGGRKFGGGDRDRGRSFGGDRGGNRSFGGDRGRDRAEMHKAVCDECGKNCEVPFKPTGDKPLFCSDCFRNKGDNNSRDSRGGGRDRGFGGRDSKPRFDNKKSFGGGDRKDAPNYKVQLDALNVKMDKILKALNIETIELKVETPKFEKKEKAPKKEVSVVDLKKAIKKTTDKEEKKPATKKKAVEKAVKKKVVRKKAITKKK